MDIRTFSEQGSFREGGTEPRKKLKKVRSVKVANLDRLRLSMRRDKSRFNRGVVASSGDGSHGTDPSESPSVAISGTSSPNYMKATTSSSARKGSLQENSGVNISVKLKSQKSLKRTPSLKYSKKLSRKRSMKIRARYSQFPDVGINPHDILDYGILGQDNTEITGGGLEFDSEGLNVSASHGQDSMVKEGAKQKGILERSRSRKMTRLRSIRSSRTKQRPQSRLSGVATELMSYEAELSHAEPHYMKGTSSQETRKNSDRGLTRTSSLRPLRILAKVPSLRPKRSKVRKRLQATPLSGTGVERATCSSTLKRTEFPDDIELHSRGQESEGNSSYHLCSYSYCSIHGHRHAPSQPLKEFISVKRKLFNNQKGGERPESQPKGEVEHSTSVAETDHSRHIVSAESYTVQEMIKGTTENAPEGDDDGIDFLIKIYAKPRKKWATEDTLNKDAEALDGFTYDQISVWDYEEKQAEILSETSEEPQGALNDDQQEKVDISRVPNVDSIDNTQQQNHNIAAISLPLKKPDNSPKSVVVDKALESSIEEEEIQNSFKDPFQFASNNSAASPGGDLINIFSDTQKYTSMWQLIHQQLLSSEASNETREFIRADEKEGRDGNTCLEMSNLDLEKNIFNTNLNEDVDDQIAVTEKLELHQTAAIKLVQEALNAILQHDAASYHQQSNPVQGMDNSSVRKRISTPTASTELCFTEGGAIDGKETRLEPAEKQHEIKQIGNRLLQKEPDEGEMSGRQMSKSFSKLRKLFVTAKFIKAMERLKKINPREPQYLSAEPSSENERVYLRHLSRNERKNTEECMLDNALRQVLSRLDPDQQRRVAQLVEAFETVTPENKEKSNWQYPVASVPPTGSKLAIPLKEEKKVIVKPEKDTSSSHAQVVQTIDDGVLVSQKGVPEEIYSRVEHEYQANASGDKTLLESDETNISDSSLVLSEKSSKSASSNTEFDDGGIVDEEPQIRFPTGDSGVSLVGGMTSISFSKQQYTGMWNLIYQHVVSSEAPGDEKQIVNEFDEENCVDTNNYQSINDRESIPNSYSMELKEDDDNQREVCENPELDQSAAIKLVKEALSAILKRYEQPTHLQSIPDNHKAAADPTDLYVSTPTPCAEENYVEGGKSAEKHTYLDLENKVHHVENRNLPLQQHVESDELKAPQRKMSKSLSKLKKAIATARFIKAMERLTKSSPRKSQNLSDTTSEEERVSLRHRSMNGRKMGEEWMLDYALRQVISKLDPDQQRRVAMLVEAFETVHPEQKEKNIICYPSNAEGGNDIVLATSTKKVTECYLESQQKKSRSIEQIPQKQDNGILQPSRDALLERSQEHHDQQTSVTCLADDIILQETTETAISDSTSDLSEDGSRVASVVGTPEEPSIWDKETGRAFEFPTPFPTSNSEVRPDGDMATILFNKQKYRSMWHLIHQHVLSNEATTVGKQEVNEVEEEEQGDHANTYQAKNDPNSTQIAQLKKSKVDEDNQRIIDQSAAIHLVKEAISAILQCHEQRFDQQSLQDHGRVANNTRELCDTTALASTEDNFEGKIIEKHRKSEPEEKLHEVENASAPLQQQAKPTEAKKDLMKISKSFSKLKKAIVTAKFIKAMERLRKINPRKPRHLSAEVVSEEERVYLRHLSINERKNDEEWMLDYALRKVLSSLAPDQQRKVALLVEAFETVNPEQKDVRYLTKNDSNPAIESESKTEIKHIPESEHDNSMSYKDDIHSMHNERLHMLGKGATTEKSVQADHYTKFPNLSSELSCKILDSDDSNLYIHHQVRPKVGKQEIDANPMHEAFQHANDPEQECQANKTEDIIYDKQKHTSMWHLIYQHVKSIGAEAGSNLSERQNSEDQMNRSVASSEIIADADADDSDASSVTSELTENDAIKLVREAINDILDVPQDLEDELPSSNDLAVSEESHRATVEEKPKKSLSRGYSKLRKFIICNKFIKAMEKKQKFYPRKQTDLVISDSEAGKFHLKASAVGVRKGIDEWMLDNVLQKVIAGLAPVQQRRVSLLVEAFEKVNPDPEERGKGLSCTKTEYPDIIFSEGDIKEKEDRISLQNSELLEGFDLKPDRSPISSREVATEIVPQQFCKDRSPGLTKEYASNRGTSRSGDPCNIIAATSDAIGALSGTCKVPTETDGTYAPDVQLEEKTKLKYEAGDQLKEGTSIGEQLVGNTELTSKFAKPPQPEDLEDEWNYSAEDSRSMKKSTNLWGLILQRVSTDMLERNKAPQIIEVNEDSQGDSTKALERIKDDAPQPSSRVKSCRDIGVQTPTSFEFQENEAIKLVEEAVEEMLLLQDQICDTESMTSITTSDQEVYSQNNEDAREPSSSAIEITGDATPLHTVATREEEKTSSREILPNSYNTISKVIMCKRFVKAMNKMQKLKAVNAQDHSQSPHSQEEGKQSLRQISTSNKTSWEEKMLDHALQKVIGNLAPAKKQRVALLVQAFESVGSQPKATNSQRGEAVS